MKDIEELIKQLDELQKRFGIFTTVIVVLLVLSILFLGKYLSKRIEKNAELTSDRNLENFKNHLNKELQVFSVKFSSQHDRETKAIEELFKKFAMLTIRLNYITEGDKYNKNLNAIEECEQLIQTRKELIETHQLNKIYIPIKLNEQIASLIPSLDNFIDMYAAGLFAEPLVSTDERDGGLVMAGIWNHNMFSIVRNDISKVQKELEELFRQVVNS